MAVIKFQNGQSVNFNGTPTQQDVEEVATKLGIQSKSTAAPVAAPAVVSAPAPLDTSTKADQATFPATGDESTVGIIGKTIGNIPSSILNFGNGVAEFLNPLSNAEKAVKAAQDIGASYAGAEGDIGGGFKNIAEKTVAEIPTEAYKALVPQFLQHIFSGDLKSAAATLENDPIGQIAPLLLTARQAAVKIGKGAEFDGAMSKIASPVTKTAAVVGDAAGNVATGATKFAGSQLTGLSPKTIEQVVSNPREFSQQAQTTVARPALAQEVGTAISDRQATLSDTGTQYDGIRTNTNPIIVSPTYLDSLIKEKTGLDVVDGKIKTSGAASVRLPSDVSALQTKIYNIWAPEFAKGYLTPSEFLNFRKDLGQMAYNDNGIGKSGTLANLSDIMRAKVNTDIRPQIAGLTELDAEYAPKKTELDVLSAGLLDKQGNLTDAAINKIANATGKGKDPLLSRLEELSPGITDKIKILKAVEDIQNSRENKPGTYTRAAVGFGGIASGNPFLIVSAILSLPEFAVPMLRGLGYSSELISKTIKTLGIKEGLKMVNDMSSKIPIVPPTQTTNK